MGRPKKTDKTIVCFYLLVGLLALYQLSLFLFTANVTSVGKAGGDQRTIAGHVPNATKKGSIVSMKTQPYYSVSYLKGDTWSPSWIGSNQTIPQLVESEGPLPFIDENFPQHVSNSDPDNYIPMLAFVRLAKTGSTTVLTWINATRPGGDRLPMYECFLGPYALAENFPPPLFSKIDAYHCAHRQYESMVLEWAKHVLPAIQLRRTRRRTNRDIVQESHFSLELFTMFRDPFDRLVSFFQYMRLIYPHWSESSTPEQTEAILSKNLTAWLELLATQPQKVPHLPYQFGALTNTDFYTAAKAIQGPRPKVFPTILECFEASLWMLTERYPRFFIPKFTGRFLDSPDTRKNVIRRRPRPKQLKPLRDKAREWFPLDFDFYDIVVDEFREHLKASRVPKPIQEECIRSIDARKAEDMEKPQQEDNSR